MMRTTARGYMAPWSSRRESVGLMGTFFIFLLGFPGHSETMATQARHVIQSTLHVVAILFSLLTHWHQPKTAKESWIPSRLVFHRKVTPPVKAVTKPVIKTHRMIDANSMLLRLAPSRSKITYQFVGVATDHGQPFANASVLVRLSTDETSVTKGTTTNADGSYAVTVSIEASNNSPIDWTMEAYSPDFKKVELSGRRIVQPASDVDSLPIVVNTPVEFILSSSK